MVHESLVLDPVDVTLRDGIPATTVARTLFDLAGVVGKGTMDLSIDDALRHELTTTAGAVRDARSAHATGTSGQHRRFREVLRDRNPSVTESIAERRALRIFERHGLPVPITQYEIRNDSGRFVARVDFAYPDLKIAIEYGTSRASHRDRRA